MKASCPSKKHLSGMKKDELLVSTFLQPALGEDNCLFISFKISVYKHGRMLHFAECIFVFA